MLTFLLIFLLSLFYILFFYRRSKNQPVRLYAGEIILGFGFAVLMGCLYGYIFRRYFGGDDTWMFNNQSQDEYQKLVHQPVQFFKDLLPIGAIRGGHGFGQTAEFYIMDLEYWLLPKMLA